MENEEILSILRLLKTKKVGNVSAKKLISVVGSASGVFKESQSNLLKINGIGSSIISELHNINTIKLAEKELSNIIDKNIDYTYVFDNDYPEKLKHCIDAPILLFKDGNINFNTSRIISIIGTRNITNYGRGFIKELIQDLKEYNPIIVSGFAAGCDIEAHKAAIENNLQTIAVFGHGFSKVYPSANKNYVHQVKENGGFLTEFFYDVQPLRENFLQRNRIVAGLSDATIVIESASRGGSISTATMANSYNREVLALPGRAKDIYSNGCNKLIKEYKANLLTCSDDIVKILNWDVTKSNKPKQIQTELFLNLNVDEQLIYDYLQQNGKILFDVIAKECKMPIYKLSSVLTTMELKGIVKKLPGKLFEI